LADNQLTGTIPESLGDMTSLKRIELEKNKLHGSIPPSISKLKNLNYVQLQKNKLDGSIPRFLKRMENKSGVIANLSDNCFCVNEAAKYCNPEKCGIEIKECEGDSCE